MEAKREQKKRGVVDKKGKKKKRGLQKTPKLLFLEKRAVVASQKGAFGVVARRRGNGRRVWH